MIRMLAAFHANDIGAQIGEQTSAERPREHMGEIQDPDAGKRRRKIGLTVTSHD